MLETPAELDALQRLLDSSRARASGHLRGIINDRRALSASNVVSLLTGMKVIAVATVTARSVTPSTASGWRPGGEHGHAPGPAVS